MTAPSGLVDLEKELTCSICTEILYQPLTLLDCLHTFCGSCLKEWFGWQKQNADKDHQRHHHARSRRKQYAFTCPSCRAVVRETRPNATVTTLLDMFLKANPEKDKPAAEKVEIAAQYTHGESVLPKPEDGVTARRAEDAAGDDFVEEEDRRLLEHVREMSLQSVGAPGPQSDHTRERRHAQPRSPPASRQSHDIETQRRTAAALATTQHLSQSQSSRAVQLGHQSSLRSLLSNAYDSEEMKEEILRQIAEEGLLDDIDWDNIQDEQEDEISERIAEAYRRRRRNRPRRPQPAQRDGASSRDVSSSRDSRRSGESQRPPRRAAEPASGQGRPSGSRPPASRPHLLENASDSRPRSGHRHQRSSSQGRELQTPHDSRPAARSATDLSEHPTSRDARHDRQRRASHGQRSSTDPNGVSISEQWRRPRAAPGLTTPSQADTSSNAGPMVQSPRAQEQPEAISAPAGSQFITVACDRCGKANIETSLHYSCPDCRPDGATYDLCLHCYRMGKGCLHWFGFGRVAWQRYERMGSPGGQAPHVLRSQRYIDAQAEQTRQDVGIEQQPQGNLLLQKGVFCDVCHENANTCYWHCDACNEGEWGFCNRCVNQARHCTHPLLPLALQTLDDEHATHHLHPLDLPCTCNVCAAAIPPEAHRLHCPDCDAGDYDVCMPCYRSLVNSGRIKAADGLHGWRRCPAGHRTLVVDFAERWRRVVDGVVGGWALEDGGGSASASSGGVVRSAGGLWSWREGTDGRRAFKNDGRGLGSPADVQPPAAGAGNGGARCVALWAWVPEEGVADELAFPRGAIVGEVVDINGDFLWGVYCRGGGLFPAGYVRALA